MFNTFRVPVFIKTGNKVTYLNGLLFHDFKITGE